MVPTGFASGQIELIEDKRLPVSCLPKLLHKFYLMLFQTTQTYGMNYIYKKLNILLNEIRI